MTIRRGSARVPRAPLPPLLRQRFSLIAALSGAAILTACGGSDAGATAGETLDEQSSGVTEQAQATTTWTRIASRPSHPRPGCAARSPLPAPA